MLSHPEEPQGLEGPDAPNACFLCLLSAGSVLIVSCALAAVVQEPLSPKWLLLLWAGQGCVYEMASK